MPHQLVESAVMVQAMSLPSASELAWLLLQHSVEEHLVRDSRMHEFLQLSTNLLQNFLPRP